MDTNTDVDTWFAEYDHPAKDAMLPVRRIILSDDRMSETIKWKSPTFMYKGDMASFNPRTKAHVSLMFHTGVPRYPMTILYWKAAGPPLATSSSPTSAPSNCHPRIFWLSYQRGALRETELQVSSSWPTAVDRAGPWALADMFDQDE